MTTIREEPEAAAGKNIGSRLYIHSSAIHLLSSDYAVALHQANLIAKLGPDAFNVVRFDLSASEVGFLQYPAFFESAFPALLKSWKVNLREGAVSYRNYTDSLNPPILHRKELLLSPDDPNYSRFAALTAELESLGFFDDSVRIGFRVHWERLLRDRGFRIVDHQLMPIGNVEADVDESADLVSSPEIARHMTALSRQNFSAPIQMLRRSGFLDGSRSIFDYGCGKGDDVRGLIANGITAAGWDPYYEPSSPLSAAQIVNLGFVINVIEDPVERRDALQRAFALTKELLVVSAMLTRENVGRVSPYGDGVLTGRSTFQKYYKQAELRAYLTATLSEEAIPVAPGIFFVFKDKEAEQRFQTGRFRSRIRMQPLVRGDRSSAAQKVRTAPTHRPDQYEIHRKLLDPLWLQCVELGREPDPAEIANVDVVEHALGSIKRALKLVLLKNDLALLESARKQRTEDLKVFFALQHFEKRKPYKQLEPGLRRDVRAFFGDYASAREQGRDLLHQIAQPEILDQACRLAAESGLGWLEPGHSLELHSSLVPRLPSVLRVYVGCGGVLYGEAKDADTIKIHVRSGKISFMKYDDFLGSALPRMVQRTKINLRRSELQLFIYGDEYPCRPLYLKSRFMNEELPRYAEQLAFDQELQKLGLIDLSGYGPSEREFSEALRRARWQVRDFHFERLDRMVDLDESCGRFLTYRQLIQCGETQSLTGLPNVPKNPGTYTALCDLAKNILDPVIDYFGSIELTYGFCSQELTRRIKGRIAPRLDQHAAHELKTSGAPVCPRLGASVDFLVRDENMRQVAEWIIATLPFDRLYFYGTDRPVHVSYGPDHSREAFEMVVLENGHRVPRRFVATRSPGVV